MIVVHAVASDAFAGVERYVASIAPRLAARGVEVRIVGGDPQQMRLAAGPAILHAKAETTLGVARALAGGGRVDIVHAHMTAAELAAVLASPMHRAAIVCTRHFCGLRGASRGGRAIAPLVRGRVAQQISVSQVVAESIGEPSVVIHNGVPRRGRGGSRDKTVLVLQRLEAEKETDLALRAWARASAKDNGWSLHIAGDGTRRRDLVALAEALGIAETVRFLGHVQDAPARLDAAGLLLATAGCEPFGLSVVEAMAVATPVVASAGGGHLETVGACSRAHLFEPGDVVGCAARLDGLIANDATRVEYGSALQRHQRSHFDIEDHAETLTELYARLL